MHWIQRDIFKKLTVSDGLRYKDLKPKDVDGNLFMYHLNQLIKEKLIQKNDKLYVLTGEGKSFVAKMSLAKGKETILPSNIVMIYMKNAKDELLLYRWSRQPYRNLVSLPFSRVRFGMSVFDAVEEVLFYKTNLKAKTKYLGDIYLIVEEEGKAKRHNLVHIFAATDSSVELHTDGLTGAPLFSKIDRLKASETVPGLTEIVKTIESKKNSFFEEIRVGE